MRALFAKINDFFKDRNYDKSRGFRIIHAGRQLSIEDEDKPILVFLNDHYLMMDHKQ